MGSRDDAVLSKLKATTQEGVLQFRPHFSKDQRRSPSESSMPGRIRTIGAQVVGIMLGPRIFTHLYKGAYPHIFFLGRGRTQISRIVSLFYQTRQGRHLFVRDGVKPQNLSHDDTHHVRHPPRLATGLIATRRMALCLSPLPLYHVVHIIHAVRRWWCRQKVTSVGLVMQCHVDCVNNLCPCPWHDSEH